jgi:3-carboxy-cis,cis-muconate cycloisomerase
VPWHVGRDGVAEFGWLCTTITATAAKLARDVVDLSRTEIAEAFEPYSRHRGASSTMPQKINPISSEILIGSAGTAGALASSLARIQEAGHERAAGEWQVEWQVVPQLAVLAGTALTELSDVIQGLRVDVDRMRTNLAQDHGLVMAEAWMMQLAAELGREHAHDLVYDAAGRARREGRSLTAVLDEVFDEQGIERVVVSAAPTAEGYLSEAPAISSAAVRAWRGVEPLALASTPVSQLAR